MPSRTKQILTGTAILSLAACAFTLRADAPLTAADYEKNPALMIDAYRHVEAAYWMSLKSLAR